MRLKKFIGGLLAVLALMTSIGCSSGGLTGVHNPVPNKAQTASSGDSSQSATTIDYAELARMWIENESVWSNAESMASNGIAGAFNTGYYLLDIDFDGKKELLVQLGGDHTQTCKTLIYRLTDGEATQIDVDENLNLSVQNLKLWTNESGDSFYINEHTLIGDNDVFKTSYSKLKFDNGILTEEPIYHLHIAYNNTTGEATATQYYAPDGEKKITELAGNDLMEYQCNGYTQGIIEQTIIKSIQWQYYTHNQKINAIKTELKK